MDRIAQRPVEPRDSSRLLVVHRDGGSLEHRRFHDLPQYLRAGDVLVVNNSRVLPARLYGKRKDTGGKIELLLLRKIAQGVWRCLGKPGRHLGLGMRVSIEGAPDIEAEVLQVLTNGERLMAFSSETIMDRAGQIPLPPYIREPLADPDRYQTIYAQTPGSVAAPTAGLHFTRELLQELRRLEVELVAVTLHIGIDTFRPVQVEDPRDHKIHSEYFEIGVEATTTINQAMKEGRRVVAVGTTSVRVLEQVAQHTMAGKGQSLSPLSGWADLFILPGHKFRLVDAMVTNFHLPRSTLLMMVCAFGGQKTVLDAYRQAVLEGYRFYSFGDAMLIV